MVDRPSNWYWLLPIFLGLIGGIIMYFVLRSRDRNMAKNGLALGAVLLVFEIGAGIAFDFIDALPA